MSIPLLLVFYSQVFFLFSFFFLSPSQGIKRVATNGEEHSNFGVSDTMYIDIFPLPVNFLNLAILGVRPSIILAKLIKVYIWNVIMMNSM